MADELPVVTGLTRAVLDVLFPRWCLGCGREGSYLCPECRRQLVPIVPPFCGVCGRPLPGPGPCANCAGLALATDGIRAPFLFGGLVRRLIHEFKYHNLRGLAPVLAGFLGEYARENRLTGDVIVPVPLHPRRLRERGYNQSELLARGLGRLLGRPLARGALARTGYTASLARTASVADRRERIKGAFTAGGGQVAGKSVILVDDVSTSGATMSAAAAALKAAGAAKVTGLAVALEA